MIWRGMHQSSSQNPPADRSDSTSAAARPAGVSNLIGILFVMGAVTMFSINDVLVKTMSGGYPLHQMTFIRGLVAVIFTLLVFMPLEGGWSNVRTTRWRFHLVRGMTVVIANMTFFTGLAVLPLGEATAIYFVGPLFITALSFFFLGERVGLRRWTAVVVGLIGVIVVIRPGASGFQAAAILPAIAAFFYASLQIMTRKLGTTEKASTMTFYINLSFVVFSGTIGLVLGSGWASGWDNASLEFLTRAWQWPTPHDWVLLIAIGVFISFGSYCISQAYRSCEAGLLAPFEYVALPQAVVFSMIFWGDFPDAIAWIGIALIAGSGLYVFLREAMLGRSAKWKLPLPRNK